MNDEVTDYEFAGQGTRKRATRAIRPPAIERAPNSTGSVPNNGSAVRRKPERPRLSRKCQPRHDVLCLGLGLSLIAIGYMEWSKIIPKIPVLSSAQKDPSTTRTTDGQNGPVYPEIYSDSHPYDYAYNAYRPRNNYRRLPLHAPLRLKRWIDPEFRGVDRSDDPWKERWYGELQRIHVLNRERRRHIKFETYADMLTAEGPPSEDDDEWLLDVHDMDYLHYYAFDDDFDRGRRVSYNGVNPDSDDESTSACRRTAIHRLMFPTCNEVHQMGFAEDSTSSTEFRFINHGTFRDVFGLMHGDEQVAIKEIRYNQDVDHEMFEYVRVDALVAERLASQPRSYDLYSYCGLSLVTEFFFHGDIESQAIWREPQDSSEDPVEPDQWLTPEQKLVICLEMAKGLALLHGHSDGMIIHGDVQMTQYLLNKDMTMLKLNDFNRAEFLLWDETHHAYCQHRNGKGHGKEYPN